MEPPPAPSRQAEPKNGLKLEQNIFNAATITEASVSSSKTRTPARRPQSGQHAQPRCQVEGCKMDLTDAKTYYSRHKVCGVHSKSPKVVVAGLEQRFCQQCSRFHELPEFDQGKRSCRRRLADHNERRRKPHSSPLLQSCYSRYSSATSDHEHQTGSCIINFSAHPKLAESFVWHPARISQPGNLSTPTGKGNPHQWEAFSQDQQPLLQDSLGSSSFPRPKIGQEQCTPGGASSRISAPSLLSAKQYEGSVIPVDSDESPPPVTWHMFTGTGSSLTFPWCFKGENYTATQEVSPYVTPVSPPAVQFSCDLALSPPKGGEEASLELDHVGYDISLGNVHWSL